MLQTLDWQPLSDRRRQQRLTMFYKMHTHQVAVDPSKYLTSKNRPKATRHENSQAYHIPYSSTDYRKMSFFPRTVCDWNQLKDPVVKASSVDAFKEALSKPPDDEAPNDALCD